MVKFSAKMRTIFEYIFIIGKTLHKVLKDLIANGGVFRYIDNKPFYSCVFESFKLKLIPPFWDILLSWHKFNQTMQYSFAEIWSFYLFDIKKFLIISIKNLLFEFLILNCSKKFFMGKVIDRKNICSQRMLFSMYQVMHQLIHNLLVNVCGSDSQHFCVNKLC